MGKYSVPENIRKLKPVGSIVKVIHNKYYVYKVKGIKRQSGNWGCTSGTLIGYIDEQKGFIPNNNYALSEEVTVLEYGQYAVVENNSKEVIKKLLEYFNPIDAYRIYMMAIVFVVNEYVPLTNIETYIEQSYLSIKHKTIKMTYHNINKLLDALGRRQGKVIEFEQSLINECSKEIAIDGHSIKSSSHENDLSEKGNKFNIFQDMQFNVLMAYDINTNKPILSKIYAGSLLDKISIHDVLEIHNFENVLFIIDRGFYSKENIELFSKNNNKYIIPLSPNIKEYKEITKDMKLTNVFVYEKGNKITTIEYKEVKINEDTKVIIYRDLSQNAIEKGNYLKNIELKPEKYSKETFEKIKELFGVIVIQTNMNEDAEEVYKMYKKRWKIETFFNNFKNKIDINAIGLSDFYTMQGMSFIMLIVGLIYEEVKKATQNIKGKSLDNILLESKFIKLCKRKNTWEATNCRKNLQEIMEKLNIDLANPLD